MIKRSVYLIKFKYRQIYCLAYEKATSKWKKGEVFTRRMKRATAILDRASAAALNHY